MTKFDPTQALADILSVEQELKSLHNYVDDIEVSQRATEAENEALRQEILTLKDKLLTAQYDLASREYPELEPRIVYAPPMSPLLQAVVRSAMPKGTYVVFGDTTQHRGSQAPQKEDQ
jgi:hypothetical protein